MIMATFFFYIFNLYFLLATVVALLWYYNRSAYNYWRKLNVKFVKPIPFFGNTASYILRRKTFQETIDLLYKELQDEPYGGIYKLNDPVLLVKDANLLTSVLVTDFKHFHDRSTSPLLNRNKKRNPLINNVIVSEGERWRILRQTMRPFFSSVKTKEKCEQILDCVSLLIERIEALMDGTESADVAIKVLMDRMAIDVTGTCAFGIECHSLKSNDKFVQMFMDFMKPMKLTSIFRFAVSIFGKRMVSLLNWRNARKEVSDFFVSLVFETMHYRRQNGITRNDLLQLLMNLQNSHIDPKFAVEDEDHDSAAEKFDEVDVAANTFLSFFAGYESTSSALTLCLYELALNEDIQQILRSEIQEIHDSFGTISYESLKEMPYLDAVISETLRKYPVVPCLYRKCTDDYVIPGTNIRIPIGTKVIVPVWSIHHDSRNYANPEVFDPERFVGNNKQRRPNGVYLPFGDGPRYCIGRHFGETEMKLALTTMILKYDLKPCAKTEIPLVFKKGTSLMFTKNAIWINLSRRRI